MLLKMLCVLHSYQFESDQIPYQVIQTGIGNTDLKQIPLNLLPDTGYWQMGMIFVYPFYFLLEFKNQSAD